MEATRLILIARKASLLSYNGQQQNAHRPCHFPRQSRDGSTLLLSVGYYIRNWALFMVYVWSPLPCQRCGLPGCDFE